MTRPIQTDDSLPTREERNRFCNLARCCFLITDGSVDTLPSVQLHFPGGKLRTGSRRTRHAACLSDSDGASSDRTAGRCCACPRRPPGLSGSATACAGGAASSRAAAGEAAHRRGRGYRDDRPRPRDGQDSGAGAPVDLREYRCRWNREELTTSAVPPVMTGNTVLSKRCGSVGQSPFEVSPTDNER